MSDDTTRHRQVVGDDLTLVTLISGGLEPLEISEVVIASDGADASLLRSANKLDVLDSCRDQCVHLSAEGRHAGTSSLAGQVLHRRGSSYRVVSV